MAYQILMYSPAVAKEVENFPVGVRAHLAHLAERMEKYGPDLGMPYTRAMGQGLFEIRAHSPEGIGRVLYGCVLGQKIIWLHAFVKKTQSTPDQALKLARKRLKELKHHGNSI